jgi:hypothetical protein
MPRGGRRPGAGAPKGNLNASKHGRTSQTHRRLLDTLARDPDTLKLLLELAEGDRRRHQRNVQKAKRTLDHLFAQLREQISDHNTRVYENNRRIPPPPGVDPYSVR